MRKGQRLSWASLTLLGLLAASSAACSAASSSGQSPPRASSPISDPTSDVATPTPASTSTPSSIPTPVASIPPTLPYPDCQPPGIVVKLSTDGQSFMEGQPVSGTLSVTNIGGPCEGSEGVGIGLCGDGQVTATGANGQVVWASAANSTGGVTNCPNEAIDVVPSGWSDSTSFSWTQDQCAWDSTEAITATTNPACPQTQVAPGHYTLTGSWSSDPSFQSEATTVTIGP
jgi:hypothetical protein